MTRAPVRDRIVSRAELLYVVSSGVGEMTTDRPTGPLTEPEIEHWLNHAGFQHGSKSRDIALILLWDFAPHRKSDLAALASVAESAVPRARRMLQAIGFEVASTVDDVDGRSHVYTVVSAPPLDGRPRRRATYAKDATALGQVWVEGNTIEAEGPDGTYLFRFDREGLTVTTPLREVQIV